MKMNWSRFGVLVACALAIGSGVASYALSSRQVHRDLDQAENLTRHLFTEVCLQNNGSKASSLVGEEQRVRLVRRLGGTANAVEVAKRSLTQVRALNVLLDCHRTFANGGGGVLLPDTTSDRYLRLVKDGWVPELDGGVIVGKHRAESEGHTDF